MTADWTAPRPLRPLWCLGGHGRAEAQNRSTLGCVLVWGISNPLEVIEQITYLMFIRRLDDIQTAKEKQAARTRQPIKQPIYGADDEQKLRWSWFTNQRPEEMFTIVRDGVFPWLRRLRGLCCFYVRT